MPDLPSDNPATPENEDALNFFQTHTDSDDFALYLANYLQRHPDASITASVYRTSNHYVHEHSVSVELRADNFEDPYTGDIPDYVDKMLDKLEAAITEDVRKLSKEIYRELEQQYDYLFSDENARDASEANGYRFTEDGDTDGTLSYDQLDGSAKERVRQWIGQSETEFNTWHEYLFEEWEKKLEEQGFRDPEISYRGFNSQGDGASFTCKWIDMDKYLKHELVPKQQESMAVALVKSLLEVERA